MVISNIYSKKNKIAQHDIKLSRTMDRARSRSKWPGGGRLKSMPAISFIDLLSSQH